MFRDPRVAECLHAAGFGVQHTERGKRATHAVTAGLFPAIPMRHTPRPPKRDGRDKPGHDVGVKSEIQCS